MHYPSRNDDDAFLVLLAEGGFVFEALAKLQYPDGVAMNTSVLLKAYTPLHCLDCYRCKHTAETWYYEHLKKR